MDGSFPAPFPARRVAEAIGVSRVARVGGLDRAGVQVACAVRPGGHVLQVSNGKGEAWAQAEQGALCEAAELWACERPLSEGLVYAPQFLLGGSAWSLPELVVEPALAGPELVRAWARAQRLGRAGDSWDGLSADGRGEVLVPASAVFCPPQTGPQLGPAAHRFTSNGMGAALEPRAALLHALLEALERDGLARCVPEGFSPKLLAERTIARAALGKGAPRTQALATRLGEAGLVCALLDLQPSRWLPVPLAGALLIDAEPFAPIPLTAGYACRLDPDEALHAALLEAAQSRLTDVHGAREDVEARGEPQEGARAMAKAALQAAAAARRPVPRAGPRTLGALVRAIGGGPQGEGLAALRIDPPGSPLAVVRVFSPGLLLSELL
jgi:ribosomal protein S12 methylthiotransferase accessory factor